MKRHLILVAAIGLIPLLAACGVTPLQTAEPPTAEAPTEEVVDTPTRRQPPRPPIPARPPRRRLKQMKSRWRLSPHPTPLLNVW